MHHLIIAAIVIGAPILVVQYFTRLPLGLAAAVTVVLVALVAFALIRSAKRRSAERRSALVARYGSEREADLIMEGRIWSGMSLEQLLDSLGKPEGIDQAVNIRKVREIWKYGRVGENRYRNRITVDDGRVASWTAKGG